MNHKLIIEATNNKWNHALNSGNIKGLAALYTENAIVSPGNGTTQVGQVAIASLFNGFIDGGVHNHTLDILEVGGSDKIIYQVARWGAQGTAVNGETPSFGGITTSIFELSADGHWLANTHIWNAN
jgi:ketosteroid isomerase-like protein